MPQELPGLEQYVPHSQMGQGRCVSVSELEKYPHTSITHCNSPMGPGVQCLCFRIFFYGGDNKRGAYLGKKTVKSEKLEQRCINNFHINMRKLEIMHLLSLKRESSS